MVSKPWAMTVRGQFLADLLNVGLKFRVFINPVLFPNLDIIGAPHADFRGFGHEHEIWRTADRVQRTTGHGGDQQEKQARDGMSTHRLNRATLTSPDVELAYAARPYIP